MFFVALVIGGTALALSRSRVGRENLKKELIAQFNREFYGELAIERLDGNLLYHLFAKNVRLKDKQGKVVLQVDSVVVKPDWFALMDNTLQIDEALLFQPKFEMQRDANGRWNVASVFEKRNQSAPPSGKRLDISSADIQLIKGQVQLHNPYDKPKAIKKGDVFDFTNLRVDNLNVTSSFEYGKDRLFADIIRFDGYLPKQQVGVKALQAQIEQLGNSIHINGLQLETGASALALFGKIQGFKHLKKFNLAELNQSQVDLTLQKFRPNPIEFKSLFPNLRLPDAELAVQIQGNPNHLQLNRLNYRQNQSLIAGNATAQIKADAVDFDLTLIDNDVYAKDVAFWLPKANLQTYEALGALRLNSALTGSYDLNRKKVRLDGSLRTQNPTLGDLAGNIRFDNATDLNYFFDGTATRFNLTALGIKDLSGALNGEIRLNGRGITPQNRTIDLKLALNNSQFRDLQFNQLQADVRLLNEQLSGLFSTETADGGLTANGKVDLSVAQPQLDIALDAKQLNLGRILPDENRIRKIDGKVVLKGNGKSLNDFVGAVDTDVRIQSVYGNIDLKSKILKLNQGEKWQDYLGEADLDLRLLSENGNAKVKGKVRKRAANPEVDLDADLTAFNLAKFFPKQPTTRLNGRFAIKGKGTDLAHFSGNLNTQMSPSTLVLNGKTLRFPAFASTIDLSKRGATEEVALELESEAADISLNGTLASDWAMDLGKHWQNALERTLQKEAIKKMYLQETATLDWTAELMQAERFRARYRNQEPMAFKGFISLKKPELVQGFLPNLNGIFPATAQFDAEINPDALQLQAQVNSPYFSQKTLSARGVQLNLNARTQYETLLTQPLRLIAALTAKELTVAGQQAFGVGADLDYTAKLGTLVLHADSLHGLGAFDAAANLSLLEQSNQITIQSLVLETARETWEIPQNQRIQVYQDALVLENIYVDRHDKNPRVPVYTVRAKGILSENPSDAIVVSTEQVELRDVSELFNTKPKLRGLFTGDVKISNGLKNPKITGEANITALSLKDKYLPEFMNIGDVSLDIAANPDNREELNLKLLLRQPRKPEPLFISENDVMATGSLQLPIGKNADGSAKKGKLDLNLFIGHLDLFFFKMLFPGEINKPTGYGYGNAKITGTFAKPIFNADLQIAKGEFEIPEFNLKPSIAGSLTVDEAGFHLHQMRLKDREGEGTAVLNGDILFNDYRFFSFNLTGEMDAFEIINVEQSKTLDFYGHIWASGKMSLVGPLDHTVLTAQNVVTTSNSELFIPIFGGSVSRDETFVVFADSLGNIPQRRNRTNLLGNRPLGERTFLDGLEMKMNIQAPEGSKVNLVFDQLLDDTIEATGNGNIKMDYLNGEFKLFGKFNVSGGDYLFTVQDFGIRRPFKLDAGGTMEWSGDPINAKLNIPASYPRRVSTNGLPGSQNEFLDLIVRMNITGEVNSPLVDLKLQLDQRSGQFSTAADKRFETELNRPERASVYATSVLISDSFTPAAALLTQSGFTLGDTQQVVFNSLFQLASNFINKVLNQLTPNVDVNVGVSQQYQTQGNNRISDLGLSLGVAWRILDDRVVLRGQGVVDNTSSVAQGNNQVEFAANYRVGSNLSTEVFYRDDNSIQTTNPFRGKTIGASLLYDRTFSNWHYFFAKPDSLKR